MLCFDVPNGAVEGRGTHRHGDPSVCSSYRHYTSAFCASMATRVPLLVSTFAILTVHVLWSVRDAKRLIAAPAAAQAFVMGRCAGGRGGRGASRMASLHVSPSCGSSGGRSAGFARLVELHKMALFLLLPLAVKI